MTLLSYGAFALFIFYGYLAFIVWKNNPQARLNRLVGLLLADLSIWAFYSTFSYVLEDYRHAEVMYTVFSFVWHIAPALSLHIAFSLSGLDKKLPRLLVYPLLYLPGLISLVTYRLYVYAGLSESGGYLKAVLHTDSPWFYLYNGYLLFFFLSSIAVFLYLSKHAEKKRLRRQSAYLGWSMLISFLLGMTNSALLPMLGISFPFVIIYWNVIWALGLSIALLRYGFTRMNQQAAVEEIMQHINAYVLFTDAQGTISLVGDFLASRVGLAPEELQGTDLDTVLGREHFFRDGCSSLQAEGKDYEQEVLLSSHLVAEGLPAAMRLHEIRQHGDVIAYLCTGHDISGFVQVRDSLRKLEGFMDNAVDGIVLSDEEGFISHWNRGMYSISGVPDRDVIGKSCLEVAKKILARYQGIERLEDFLGDELSLSLRTGEASWTDIIHDMTIVHQDGTKLRCHVKPFFIASDSGYMLAVIIRDVEAYSRVQEERIRLIKQLASSQRMKTIGTLTGGLAHNFNNILAGIYGASSLLRRELEEKLDKELVTQRLELIESASQRGADIVRQLLSISGDTATELEAVDLVPLCRNLLNMCRQSFDDRVEIRAELPEQAVVEGDRSQLEQALLNLVMNALHAMTIMREEESEWGGVLALRLSFIDGQWKMIISDTGVGMDEDTLAQAWDPFFTTKGGEGSGFGLSMVQRMMVDIGGKIKIDSLPQMGTSVRIFFRARNVEQESRETALDSDEFRKPDIARDCDDAGQLVLFCDDDIMVRRTSVRMLEYAGYRVLAAEDAEKALELYEKHQQDLALLIADQTMPGLSGSELREEIHRRDSTFPVLLCTGGSIAHLEPPILAKPYNAQQLVRRVEELLGSCSESPLSFF